MVQKPHSTIFSKISNFSNFNFPNCWSDFQKSQISVISISPFAHDQYAWLRQNHFDLLRRSMCYDQYTAHIMWIIKKSIVHEHLRQSSFSIRVKTNLSTKDLSHAPLTLFNFIMMLYIGLRISIFNNQYFISWSVIEWHSKNLGFEKINVQLFLQFVVNITNGHVNSPNFLLICIELILNGFMLAIQNWYFQERSYSYFRYINAEKPKNYFKMAIQKWYFQGCSSKTEWARASLDT